MTVRHDRDDCLDASSHRPTVGPVRAVARPLASSGYTLAEVLIGMGIVVALTALLVPVFSRARQASRSVACLSNLHHLTGAFRSYAADNNNRLPYPAVTTIPWERSLLKYVPSAAFVCPGDEELAPATNSSYDWRDTGVPSTTLAGLRIDSSSRPDAVLVFDSLPGWHQPSRMNVGLLDGSARSMQQDECISDLIKPIRP